MHYYGMEQLRLRVLQNPLRDGYDLLILLKPKPFGSQVYQVVSSVTFKEIEQTAAYPLENYEPLRFGREAAQELLDELWRHGLRPTEQEDPNGRVLATERHLKDMRKIVNQVLGTDLGELK